MRRVTPKETVDLRRRPCQMLARGLAHRPPPQELLCRPNRSPKGRPPRTLPWVWAPGGHRGGAGPEAPTCRFCVRRRVSRRIRDTEHLFVCFLVIHASSLERFLSGSSFVVAADSSEFFIHLDVNPCQACNLQVFFPFRRLSFRPVDFVPRAQQFLTLPSPNL